MKIRIYKKDDDYDFEECLKYAPFKLEDIKGIIACVPGEADGPDWHYIVRLKKGYGYVHAGCDYTGWGCQEDGEGYQEGTIKKLLEHVINEDYARPELKTRLIQQMKGKQPYGCY